MNPSMRSLKRSVDELALSIYCYLQDMILLFILCFCLLFELLFFIGIEKAPYFSAFSPEQVNFPSNSFASLFMISDSPFLIHYEKFL